MSSLRACGSARGRRLRSPAPTWLPTAGCAVLAVLLGSRARAELPGGSAKEALQVLERLTRTTALEATFHEEKHLAMLVAPLASDGRLYFLAPDHLRREVTGPSPSTLIVDGATVHLVDDQGPQSFSLDQVPAVGLVVGSVLKILSGDVGGLSDTYDLGASTDKGGVWTLRLRPKSAPLKLLIDRIVATGRGVSIARLSVREVGGDETVITFGAVNSSRVFSAAEQRRLFSVPGTSGGAGAGEEGLGGSRPEKVRVR